MQGTAAPGPSDRKWPCLPVGFILKGEDARHQQLGKLGAQSKGGGLQAAREAAQLKPGPTPRLHAPVVLAGSLPGLRGRGTAGPGPARPVPGARGKPRDAYRRPGRSGLPPPPAVLPASSSGTSRCRLCEARGPRSRSRRLPPAFQAAPDPPLPLPAGSHFRQATAELAEERGAGNGRTRARDASGAGARAAFPSARGESPRPRAAPPGSRGPGAAARGIVGSGRRGRGRARQREGRARWSPRPAVGTAPLPAGRPACWARRQRCGGPPPRSLGPEPARGRSPSKPSPVGKAFLNERPFSGYGLEF
ncbi:Triple Functional Domain Protein [Manis pentadactyla]|nr:Triple Functional Domain Protein [Manis pentadactyla]